MAISCSPAGVTASPTLYPALPGCFERHRLAELQGDAAVCAPQYTERLGTVATVPTINLSVTRLRSEGAVADGAAGQSSGRQFLEILSGSSQPAGQCRKK